MVSSTRGIVFHQLKYSETSIIAKIYTEEFGLQSYIVKGVHRKKSKNSSAVLQHLSLVELTANHKNKNNMHHVREIRASYVFQSIPYDILKSSVLLLINELLYRSIQEEEANPELFEFIYNSLQWFDLSESGFANFHLVFLIQLTKYLGFFPKGERSENTHLFNLESGNFESALPMHLNYLSDRSAQQFSDLVKLSFENMSEQKLNNVSRNLALEDLIKYYQLHLPNLGNPKSLKILKEVLS